MTPKLRTRDVAKSFYANYLKRSEDGQGCSLKVQDSILLLVKKRNASQGEASARRCYLRGGQVDFSQ